MILSGSRICSHLRPHCESFGGQLEAERMVTRSGKRISLTDSLIRVSVPAPASDNLLLFAVELGLRGASSASKIRFPKASLHHFTVCRECLCLWKVASRKGHKKLKDMDVHTSDSSAVCSLLYLKPFLVLNLHTLLGSSFTRVCPFVSSWRCRRHLGVFCFVS